MGAIREPASPPQLPPVAVAEGRWRRLSDGPACVAFRTEHHLCFWTNIGTVYFGAGVQSCLGREQLELDPMRWSRWCGGTVAAAGATIERLRRLTDRAWPLSERSALFQWPASRGGAKLVCLRHSVIGPSLPCAVLRIACCGWRGWRGWRGWVGDGSVMGDGGQSGAIVGCQLQASFGQWISQPALEGRNRGPFRGGTPSDELGLGLRPVLLTGARPAECCVQALQGPPLEQSTAQHSKLETRNSPLVLASCFCNSAVGSAITSFFASFSILKHPICTCGADGHPCARYGVSLK